jgi:hypothetical protein
LAKSVITSASSSIANAAQRDSLLPRMNSSNTTENFERERQSLYDSVKLSVQILIDQHAGTGIPVEDNSPEFQLFSSSLDRLFQHGLQKRVWTVRTQDYWVRFLFPQILIIRICCLK